MLSLIGFRSVFFGKFVPFWLFFSCSIMLTAQCPQLIWQDEFEGSSLDLSKWEYQTGDGCDIDLCGWGNNELQYYKAENAAVSNGTLKITAKREDIGDKRFSSARIRTKGRGDWTYGRFEARIKLPTGRGLWPAFWMLPTDEVYGGWPQSGEIDIMELIGSEPATVHGTIHYGNAWPQNQSSGESFELHTGIFNDQFHEFAIEWEPGEIRWYVDDYLYATKTKSSVAPYRWPFDRDFHFLLNVAVGGNWPGAPNSSTSFPQVMEVDYVRVYDGTFADIRGERRVAYQAEGVSYSIGTLPENATVTWNVPSNATIVSGQGTNRITVDWGETGGAVTADISSPCGDQQLSVEVLVEPAFVPLTTLENFDQSALINFDFATGTLTDNVNNPDPDPVNSSALSGRYVRNASEQYDVLIYQTQAISDAGEFVDGEKKLFLDVYTDAPAGTLVLLQLENSSRAQNDYPIGRHSRFEARTSKQNEWERLEFTLLDRPDAGTSDFIINQLTFLFASNSRTGNTYYFDNFEIYGPQSPSGLFTPAPPAEKLELYPNPAGDYLMIGNEKRVRWQDLQLLDLYGRTIQVFPAPAGAPEVIRIPVKNLPAGTYLLRGIDEKGVLYTGRFVKE